MRQVGVSSEERTCSKPQPVSSLASRTLIPVHFIACSRDFKVSVGNYAVLAKGVSGKDECLHLFYASNATFVTSQSHPPSASRLAVQRDISYQTHTLPNTSQIQAWSKRP